MMSGAAPILMLMVVGGVLTATVVIGVVVVRQHRRRRQQASIEGGPVGQAATNLDFKTQQVAATCSESSATTTSSSSGRRITPPGLELDLDTEDAQADLADVAVSKATCHLCGGFFCSVVGNCSSSAATGALAANNAANSASSDSGEDVDNSDAAALRRLRACRVRGEIVVTAADVCFRRGLSSSSSSSLNFAGDDGKSADIVDDYHREDNDEEAAASYFFHRGLQPAEHQLMERVPSCSGTASLAALPGHDYRLWRCPARHAVKSLLCYRCRPLLSFQLTPRRGGGGGEILFDHRRSGRRVWIASAAYAGPLSCLIRLPLPQSTGDSQAVLVIQFGAEVPDGVDSPARDTIEPTSMEEATGSKRAVQLLQTVQEKNRPSISVAGGVVELKPDLPQQISVSNRHILCPSSEDASAYADTEPDTENDEEDHEDDVYTTATAAAATAANTVAASFATAATGASGDLALSDCDAATTSTVSAQTEWSSLRKRAAASATAKWAAISMQEVADQLESSSSPGVEELQQASCRSPADGSSIELATVGAGDAAESDLEGGGGGAAGVSTTAASALSAARAAADAATRCAGLDELTKVGSGVGSGGGGVGLGTDVEYLRFMYSSDASSSGGGDDVEEDVEGNGGGGGGVGGTSRRSSADFYSAESNVTSRLDVSSQ